MATADAAGTTSPSDSVTDTADGNVDDLTVMSGLSKMLASMHNSMRKEENSATAAISRENIASVIGKLKLMDKAIIALGAPPTLQSIQLVSDMAELARETLPEDTRKALDAVESGNDVALELVRRNLTQLPALAKTLYEATPDALAADDGLCSLHAQLAPNLELYGALVANGVDPRRRPWAQKLTQEFSTLTELKWLSWRRLMHTVGMGVILGLEENADGVEDAEEVTLGWF